MATDLPLGPLSMSAYLKKHEKVDVKLVDFNVELNWADEFPFESFYDYCLSFLRELSFSPDIVGVSSLFSPSFHNFMDCGKAAGLLFPSALVIGGGNIPTNSYRHIYSDLGCSYFHALCYGEGEKPLLELVQSKDRESYIAQSDSWVTKDKLEHPRESFVPKHDFIENLDDIPFYDYALCDLERHGLNPVMSAYAHVKNQKGFHVMTSRGCPFKCTFCASHKVHGRKMRYHSVKRVREDFSRLKDDFGATTVIFQDDHLMGDKDRVYEILEIIGQLELEAVFQNGLTLYALDRPMLEAFHKAGVRQLVLPIESGSEKVLKEQMKKPLKLGISQRVANDCRDLGIYTNSNILIGMPGETKADIEEARRNLRNINTNWFHIVCASPIVGSEMHENAVAKNFIRGDTLGADYRNAVITTDDFTAEYIQEMQYVMNLELNFVHNNDFKHGDYESALQGFLNVIRVKSDHAFAYFFAARCYAGLGNIDTCNEYFDKARKYGSSSFWQRYAKYFDVPLTDHPSDCDQLAMGGLTSVSGIDDLEHMPPSLEK